MTSRNRPMKLQTVYCLPSNELRARRLGAGSSNALSTSRWLLDVFRYVFAQCGVCGLYVNALSLSSCPSCGSNLPLYIDEASTTSSSDLATLSGNADFCRATLTGDTGQTLTHIDTRTPPPLLIHQRSSALCRQPSGLIQLTGRCTERRPVAPSPASYTLLLTNCRSIRNKVNELQSVMHERKADVVVLTETWLDANIPDSTIYVEGYKSVRMDRNQRGGGILIYIREFYQHDIVPFDITHHSDNSNVLCLRIRELSLLLVCIYHPHWNCLEVHRSMLDDLMRFMLTVKNNERIALCGDVNDLRLHLDSLYAVNGLVQAVPFATRNGHTLDIYATNHHSSLRTPRKLSPLFRSDHAVVMIECHGKEVAVEKRLVRNFQHKYHVAFRDKLLSADWAPVYNSSTVCSAAESFHSILSQCMSVFPFRTIRWRTAEPPWMTISIKLAINDRDKALRRHQIPKYRALRERVHSMIARSKSDHIAHQFNGKSQSDGWRIISRLTGKAQPNNNTITQKKADELNDKFANVFVSSPDNFEPLPLDPDADVVTISVSEVITALQKQKKNSPGPDGVPGFIYRIYAETLGLPLANIFNKSLRAAEFPSYWKRANIVAVGKSNGDFRPISLLSIPSKILERFFLQKVLMLRMNPDAFRGQFAFVPGQVTGTTVALTAMRLWTLSRLDTGAGAVRMLSIDFSKAFDVLCHAVLLNKLVNTLKMPNWAVNWIASFLRERKQRVTAGPYKSSWKHVSSGVPQGSVLGPVLFAALVSDYNVASQNSRLIAYADDFTILHHIPKGMCDALQDELDKFVQWSRENKLIINPEKTKVINLSNSIVTGIRSDLVLDGTALSTVLQLRLLGITFSRDLRWSTHFEQVITKCRRGMYIVNHLKRSGVPPKSVWIAYNAFVVSIMSYAWPAVCDAANSDLKSLECLDRYAQRLCCMSNIPPLKERLNMRCMKLFRQVEKNPQHPLREFFTLLSDRSRRSGKTLTIPRCRTSRLRNTFVRFAL